MNEEPFRVNVQYTYKLVDDQGSCGEAVCFDVDVDIRDERIKHYVDPPPSWCKLSHRQCPGCPLSVETNEYCPAALAIADVVELFANVKSFALCHCVVEFSERKIEATRPVQDALYPLLGLRLSTSRCPVLHRLSPMARFHEPFATPLYTIFRSLGYFLLQDYVRSNVTGQPFAFNENEMKSYYEKVGEINRHLSERLADAKVLDASPNGMFILSLFTMSLTYLFDQYKSTLIELCEKA
jgi:hypothetical protein